MCFLLSETVLKISSHKAPHGTILLLRSLFILLFITSLTFAQNKLYLLHTRRIGLHCLRGFFSTLSLLCTLKALSYLPTYSVTAISYLREPLIALCGLLFFNEIFHKRYLLAATLCILGVIIAFTPGHDVWGTGGIYAICAAVCGAMAVFIFKKMIPSETTCSIIFYYGLMSLGVSLTLIDFQQFYVDVRALPVFALISALHLAGSFFYTHALRVNSLTSVAFLDFLTLPLSLGVDYFVWHTPPSTAMALASTLIVLANVLIRTQKKYLFALLQLVKRALKTQYIQ